MKNNSPDYKRIFQDVITMKYPEKHSECHEILEKRSLSVMDIIMLNRKIFGIKDKENFNFNQKHRFYDKESIIKILLYQKKHNLNNSQLARHFKLSRNSITKWKQIFKI